MIIQKKKACGERKPTAAASSFMMCSDAGDVDRHLLHDSHWVVILELEKISEHTAKAALKSRLQMLLFVQVPVRRHFRGFIEILSTRRGRQTERLVYSMWKSLRVPKEQSISIIPKGWKNLLN